MHSRTLLPLVDLYQRVPTNHQDRQEEWRSGETVDDMVERVSGFFSSTDIDEAMKDRMKVSPRAWEAILSGNATTGMMIWDVRARCGNF